MYYEVKSRMSFTTKLHVLMLQHPQEPDKQIGTARLAHETLANSSLVIGLSWPNLARALGRPSADPKRWAVLYLGSGIKAAGTEITGKNPGLFFVDKKGRPVAPPLAGDLDGIIVLDGTWSQAKAIWWRNAWLLKLRRMILIPERPSLYGRLRKEPRSECLSSIEAIALTLGHLGEEKSTCEAMIDLFSRHLAVFRQNA
ncbi:MAG: hypothetical protein A2583_12345 [Bdellovibrionales bacterium RIFOXYD1_FULL_53_11]|nr:MAG: hypothetical protein A2583_12345 [Bdellovibrionales bacterium RIFOXYD1_FULL_53_11]